MQTEGIQQHESAERTERIRLWGIVQGVGFRPHVAKTAHIMGMKGRVLNTGGLVEITVTDTKERISAFLHVLKENKPAPSEIVHISRGIVEHQEFDGFEITGSSFGDDETAMIPADLAICPDCLRELYCEENPRHQHPFISCMICGPRYTIIDRLPYDRENTSMADFPMCDFCSGEYTDLKDRRHHAQTISCHGCGPQLLWADGDGCDPGHESRAEWIAEDRPYQAHRGERTAVSLHRNALKQGECNIVSSDERTAAVSRDQNEEFLDHAASVLHHGGVILFKSVGGYNLVADPFNYDAALKLRRIKGREAKPFALMFRSVAQVREYCHVNDVEEKLLMSSARPILLLERKAAKDELPTHARCDKPSDDACGSELCDGTRGSELSKSRFIGSFLPSFAAQYMLLDRISPLIFTSANLSDLPMIRDDDEALAFLHANPEIDGMLYNKRQIRIGIDDSVARVIDGHPQMIRRSKGYSPMPLYAETRRAGSDSSGAVLAVGGQLKNSFALTKETFIYMSQYFGDMDTVENQQIYEENVSRMEKLFRIRPSAAACDLHPLYVTTRFAEHYAKAHGLPLVKVQHHHAHVASVMAENQLTGKVIGVSFDGTGYGTDGCIWGGEFLLCEGAEMERIAHLRYVDMIGGDASVKDAVRSALSYMHAALVGESRRSTEENRSSNEIGAAGCIEDEYAAQIKNEDFQSVNIDLTDIITFGRDRLLQHPMAPTVMAALKTGINTVKSSSMGRLFDAVSALLGICDYNHYEGQCAILLEDAAAFAQKHPGQRAECDLALAFHHRIIDMILEQCRQIREKYDTGQVALTGGTFQNKILMEGALAKLRADGFTPYYNISVSPNDGGIALGQAYVAMQKV